MFLLAITFIAFVNTIEDILLFCRHLSINLAVIDCYNRVFNCHIRMPDCSIRVYRSL